MTNSIIPYSFTPGTKAKAQEVNANFNALAEKIEEYNSKAIYTNSNTSISGELTFSAPIYSSGKHHDTKGNFSIINIAENEICDAVLTFNDNEIPNSSMRVKNGDGYNEICLMAYNADGSGTSTLGLKNTNETSYAYAPTYNDDYADNSDKIVTTKFLANRWVTKQGTSTTTASTNRPAVVIQNYKNGTSWYRIWSDGWKEQGGYITSSTNNASTTITLLKTMSDTNYTIIASSRSTTSAADLQCHVTSIAKNQFVLSGWGIVNRYWLVCGY